jgi:predicted nucleic-acid-binding Zn-ribbon protein
MGTEGNPVQATRSADDLAELVRESFPDLRCLRCTHDNFYILPSVDGHDHFGTIAIACQRCGFVETHLIGLLRSATKPIVPGARND